jgi:hypothetical protein
MEGISERTSEIPSKFNCGFGKDAVKGRDERKERALDNALSKQRMPHALLTAKNPKKSLDNADAVIHGLFSTAPSGSTLSRCLLAGF